MSAVRLWLLCVVALAALGHCTPEVKAAPAIPRGGLLLAQCMVGEAGWKAAKDHAAIGYTLVRRHRQVIKRHPGVTFSQQVLGYCMALQSRRAWVRRLVGDDAPLHWPAHRASWARHRPLWRAALARAAGVLDGTLKDPCPGSIHWAGREGVDDLLPGRPVLCDWGFNRFQGGKR